MFTSIVFVDKWANTHVRLLQTTQREISMHKPWEINQSLKQEYLIQMASFISDVRADVVDLYDPDGVGDTLRGLGFRAYECCRNRIIQEAAYGDKPWLSIITEEKRFTFGIESVPVRFYRGNPGNPEERRLIPSTEALSQMSLLPISESDAVIIWMFAIETDELRYADKVTFCGFDSVTFEQVCLWEIPLQDKVFTTPTPIAPKEPAVMKSPIEITIKKKVSSKLNNKA